MTRDLLIESDYLGQTEDPIFCPRCGRALEWYYWITVDDKSIYPSRVCYNGAARWKIKLSKILGFTRTLPHGAHYQYELPSEPWASERIATRFDRQTGEPLE